MLPQQTERWVTCGGGRGPRNQLSLCKNSLLLFVQSGHCSARPPAWKLSREMRTSTSWHGDFMSKTNVFFNVHICITSCTQTEIAKQNNSFNSFRTFMETSSEQRRDSCRCQSSCRETEAGEQLDAELLNDCSVRTGQGESGTLQSDPASTQKMGRIE